MPCTRPRRVGFKSDGKSLSFSPKTCDPQYPTFDFPCQKCLSCRLDYSRQWAIRCVHEARMHSQNSFITLTYDDTNLGQNKLDYREFQLFMKKLRKLQNEPIGMFVTGEYGEKSKRKHWHLIAFGYWPLDAVYKRSTDRGDKVYSSEVLTKLWGKGAVECGDVTIHSAGYCARYSAKKLNHGKDQDHSFHPISKKSSRYAIGKKFLETHWPDIFNHGKVIVDDGQNVLEYGSVPRYYEKWFKENHPDLWDTYVKTVKIPSMDRAQEKSTKEKEEYQKELYERFRKGRKAPITRLEIEEKVLLSKTQQLTGVF